MQEQLFITDGYTVQNYNVSVCTIGNSGYFNLPQNNQLKDSFNSSPIEKRTVDDFGNVIKTIKIFDINFDFNEERRKLKEELKGFKRNINYDKEPWIQTYTGKKFFPLNPREEDICIEDIAHALSHICRFSGHVEEFYSVAQHCVLVSYFCYSEDAKHGLAHDWSEALLNDIASPVKRSDVFTSYREVENNLQSMIYRKFGLDAVEPPSVKRADLLMLATEAKCLLKNLHPEWKLPVEPIAGLIIDPLSPKEAKKLFMRRFNELFL